MKPSQRLAAKLDLGLANRSADEELAWLEEEEAMWEKIDKGMEEYWKKPERAAHLPMAVPKKKKSFWERLFEL